MLPWLILAGAAVVLVVAFVATRRSTASAEHPPNEDDATLLRNEQEFADAEAYQEQWRKEQHEEHPPESLY